MRVLVTGGAGFIGSHLVDALKNDGHEVTVIDIANGDDVCDATAVNVAFDSARPIVVFHQAAQASVTRSIRTPSNDAIANIIGTINVLDACRNYGVRRIIHASSGGVLYGNVNHPAVETDALLPESPYGISKLAAEQYVEFYARTYGIKAIALRYSNVYGPRQNPHGECGVVATFCQQLLEGTSPELRGGGNSQRDYVHVADVVRANMLAMAADVWGDFTAVNVGTGISTRLRNLASMIHELCPESPSFSVVDDMPGELASSCVNPSLAKTLLGWEPQIDLRSGLAATVKWYAEQGAMSV